MNEKQCMNCNAPMYLDCWDTVDEQEDGTFLLDIFEA